MKSFFGNLNKVFDSRIRLAIMSLLMIHEAQDYNTLKTALDTSDGNLASHLAALEKAEYLSVYKSFLGRKPHTTYKASAAGREAFTEHLNALENIIKGMNGWCWNLMLEFDGCYIN